MERNPRLLVVAKEKTVAYCGKTILQASLGEETMPMQTILLLILIGWTEMT